MPNICSFDIKAIGKKENIIKLNEILNADYYYGDEKIDNPVHVGGRVFEAELSDMKEYDRAGNMIASIFGSCAWSCWCCMFEGEGTYYNDLKKYPNYKGCTLPQLSKELNLKIELFSSEPGVGFAEHYYMENGSLLIEEEDGFSEFYFGQYDTKEEAEKNYGKKIDNELWNSEDCIVDCVFLDRYDNWKWEKC